MIVRRPRSIVRLAGTMARGGALTGAVALVAACGALPIDALPLSPGARECAGIPAAKCEEIAGQRAMTSQRVVVAYRIRCTVAACTPEAGSVEVMVIYSGGRVEIGGAFWVDELPPQTAPPQTGPPVTPATIAEPT